ncbi:hypothetical protein [Deinococcus sp. S9]|uniref:hypothetical protein n=1 Tax=Deinococcus sp. S9 TaxID=2545754 RepID=UPI001054B390|nr:hypothetical protein [Deinococcus sp. S9]TDE87347.1 hypothetical protein E0686_02305 [Deinococcus sp. S9]
MRHVITPERELEYLDALFCPGRDIGLNHEMEKEMEQARDLFVARLGWTREQCARFPFRALAAVSRPGEWVMARLKGPADYAAELPREMLELTLREVAALPQAKRRAYVEEALLPDAPEVSEFTTRLKTRFRFSEKDRAFIRRLAEEHGIEIGDHDRREGDPALGRAILKLLRLAYEKEAG